MQQYAQQAPVPPHTDIIVSWLEKLRCPTRISKDEIQSDRGISGAGSSSKMPNIPQTTTSCQEASWQILISMSRVIALLCSNTDLKIKDASKLAFTIWGSSALRRGTLQNLLNQPTLGACVAKKVADASIDHCSLINIGCLELWNRQGTTFDAMVTCALLPEEQGLP